MRIAVGQLWQETNTFNRCPTTWADFENWGLAEGERLFEQYGETGEIGGFLARCREWRDDLEFVGLARFVCWPWGSVDSATWTRICETFATRLADIGQVDAVFLALHGAMAAENEPDVTGAILEQVRQAVGKDVPIVGSLDLHANITRRMLDNADVLAGYHACPHLDSVETGARAASGLIKMIENDVRPVTYRRKLPMITAAEKHETFTGPPASLYRRLEALECEPGILTAGIYMAMPWFDCPHLGWTVTLTAEQPNPSHVATVDQLAADCWKLRDELGDVDRLTPDELVEQAIQHVGHPVVVGDGADATNSGAPGDSTHLLAAFLKRDTIPNGALTFLVDPEAVAHAYQAGVEGIFDFPIGGSFAPEYSEPLRFRGNVERLLNVDFVLDGHISRNMPIHMGRGAVVRSGDVTVLLVEKGGPGSTPRLYETAGLDPRTFGIVVAKSPAGFRADYGEFASKFLLADCPGCASPNWPRMNFLHVDRPLWPLNSINSPAEASWCSTIGVS